MAARTHLDRLANPETWSTTLAGILFDLDGTLVDSTAVVERQWWTFLDWYGLPAEAFPEPLHGKRAEDHIRGLLPDDQVADAVARLSALEATDIAGVTAVPGAATLLDAVAGVVPWGIVTSGTYEVATARLAAAGLPTPGVLVTAEDVRAGKPDPEPYLIGLERLGAAGPVVVFEDAPAGIRSGREAGCPVVAVTTSHPAADLAEADVVVPDLTAIALTAPARDDSAVLTAAR
ncbi:HAD-IA family hydrolase [Cryptosporangium aurantiacum]|uniref:Sugar-phosphatase n=1 Tax=Cryptosporangium aurantiacum TaxID=134849 RepID=A0A1M7RH56_9ACTN|nr:HAD-IA family hydrolase [Cryptosporangium aurantiacum]SHN45645.1 sugar-phosphatase [Cryptosporangium aurantiacum]